MDIQTFKAAFDPILARITKKQIQKSLKTNEDPFIQSLIQEVEPLTMAGGKRIRPYMACLAYQVCGGKKTKPAMELFTALELFHVFALIHDDIIDNGISRHGRATIHRFVTQRLTEEKRRGECERNGLSQAILIGDLVFSWAGTQMMNEARFDQRELAVVRSEYQAMIDEVVVGQMVDVDTMTRHSVSSQLIHDKMRLKTASYTFVRPLRMGVALAGGSSALKRFCDAYGMPLGIGFQIQDDLLDLTATADTMKKTVFSDLREHQHTLFTQFIFEQGSASQKKELATMLGSELQEKDRSRVQALFHESGALDYGRCLMTDCFNQAEDALEKVKLTEKQKQPFADLVKFIRHRSH